MIQEQEVQQLYKDTYNFYLQFSKEDLAKILASQVVVNELQLNYNKSQLINLNKTNNNTLLSN